MSMLDAVLIAPLIGFLLLLLLPKGKPEMIRNVALALTGIVFGLSLALLVTGLQYGKPGDYLIQTDAPWIEYPAIRYHVGVDGMSIWLVMLSTVLTPLAVLISWRQIEHRSKEFYAMVLLLEFALIGVFSSLDLFLFYVFFELTLVPMLLMMGIWGGVRRSTAAMKFFIYTLLGSLMMLGAMIFIYGKANTFDLLTLQEMMQSGRLSFTHDESLLLFLGFFLAFAIKLGLFPLHTWLPDAYTEAPIGGTLLLSAVMSKMGTYGLLRFCLMLFPSAARSSAKWIVVLAIIGVIYGACIAIIQQNMKRLVAYSSVSHMAMIVLGIFSFRQIGLDGAAYQMLAHGLSTGALFVFIGMLMERRRSMNIVDYGGIATPAPWLATVFLIASLASIGLPTLSNFVGEFLILQGSAQANFQVAIFAAIGVILSACYMLWMYQRTFLGETNPEAVSVPDLNTREWAIAIPLVILMVWLGTAAQTFLPSISASNSRLMDWSEKNVETQVKREPLTQPTVGVANVR